MEPDSMGHPHRLDGSRTKVHRLTERNGISELGAQAFQRDAWMGQRSQVVLSTRGTVGEVSHYASGSYDCADQSL